MKKIYFIALLAFLGLNFHLTAQPPNFLWAKQLSGSSLNEYGSSITVDNYGNVYTTGSFGGTVDFDPGPGFFNLTSAGSYDVFVSKLDASGNFLWAKRWGGSSGSDGGSSITIDVNGNVYTTGTIHNGTIDFDPGPGVYNLVFTGNYHGFVSKLDPSGNFLWARISGGLSSNSIAVNSFGNVSTTGAFYYTADFDPGPGTFPLTASSNDYADIFISTLDASGNFLWAKQIGGIRDDEGLSIAIDAAGNVCTTGYFKSMTDFDPGPGTFEMTSAGCFDVFISKLDPAGNFLWAKRWGSSACGDTAPPESGTSIAVDATGNVYTTGYVSYDDVDFDPGPAEYFIDSHGGDDIFVTKLDASGNFLWAKRLGEVYDDRGWGIAVDATENVYVSGYFSGSTVFKLDASGDLVWEGHLGRQGNSIAVDTYENVYVTGYFTGTDDFDPSNGTYNLTALGQDDAFVVKLCQLAPPTISGPTSFCQGSSISLTASSANSYLWSNGATTQSITVSTQGNYSVVVSNANGCTAASTITTVIGNNLPPTPTITTSGQTTFCQGGSVMLTSSTATSYLWSNGATTKTITVTSSGDYKVTVSNAAGCTTSSTGIITVTVFPSPTVTVTPNGSTTFCQGNSVTLTASLASSYLWSNGATTQSIVVSSSGNYSVIVTNGNGCTANSSPTTVTVNPLPAATITPNGPTTFCQGSSVILTASLASSYLWSNGATTQSITVSGSGSYSVIVTNANGCTAASSATTVTVNFLPTAIITPSGETTFCQGNSVTLAANLASFYLWSNGTTTQNIMVSSSGNYSVTITNANGCTAVSSPTTVTVNPSPPTPNITPNASTTFCQGESVMLTASLSGSYLWSNAATTQSITVSSSGNFSVTVTNANGCTAASTSTIVTVNPLPTATITPNGTTTFCQGNSVTLTASSAISYLWSNGAITQSIAVSSSGNYSVTITNANGCTAASSATSVTVHPSPSVNLGPDISLPTGPAILDATGPGLAYLWSNGATTAMISVTSMGTYSVTVTNTFSCTATDAVVVHFTVSTNNLDDEYSLTISPNPTQGMLNILCEGRYTTSAQVIDNLGKVIFEGNDFVADGEIRTINLEKIPSGAYHIRVIGKGFTRTVSIIKH